MRRCCRAGSAAPIRSAAEPCASAPCSAKTTRCSAPRCGVSSTARSPRTTHSGARRHHPARAVACGRRGRPAQLPAARTLRPGRRRRACRLRDRGTGAGQFSRYRLLDPFGHGRAVHDAVRQRCAARRLVAEDGARRGDRRDRDDRARRRQRPQGDPHPRPAPRRALPAQRPEDLDQQRQQRRRGGGGGDRGAGTGRARLEPVLRRNRAARRHPWRADGQDRPARTGHQRAVLPGRGGACSARNSAASTTSANNWPPNAWRSRCAPRPRPKACWTKPWPTCVNARRSAAT